MAFISKISAAAKTAVAERKPIRFRILIDQKIMDRVLTPIDTNIITMYNQVKEEYSTEGFMIPPVDYKIIPVYDLVLVGKKNMPSTNTVNDQIYELIATLEKSGYVLVNL